VLHLASADRWRMSAVDALKPTGVPLELAAKDYAERGRRGRKGSLLEVAKEFARRYLHELRASCC